MNSSSRAIATAREKRAGGNNPPPVSGNRPGTRPNTSIHSANVFNPNQPPQQGFNYPRLPVQMQPQQQQQMTQQQQYARQQQMIQQQQYARQQQMIQQQQSQQQQSQQQQQQYEQNMYEPQKSNALPFSKLSTSDAIGLITLRLGAVEKFIIDFNHEQNLKEDEESAQSSNESNALIATLIQRIETLEKRETPNYSQLEQVEKVIQDITKKQEDTAVSMKHIDEEFIKTKTTASKHTEDLFKLKREVLEIGDSVKTFRNMYDYFVKDTGEKFSDFEAAIADIETKINFPDNTLLDANKDFPMQINEELTDTKLTDTSVLNDNEVDTTYSYSIDQLLPSFPGNDNNTLKSIVENELSKISI